MTYDQCVRELYCWQRIDDADNFHAVLYNLIAKSDPENRERLRAGFPDEVKAFEDWQAAPSAVEFFAKVGLKQ
jgi:hypothetical protein